MKNTDTKTQQAVSLLKFGNVKEALKIFKTFRIGFSKEEKRLIEIASDCLCGMSDFYTSLGIDCPRVVDDAVSILRSKYY